MGSLRDEAYEKLDYLSQITEVVLSPQAELLAELPDRVELSFEDLEKCKRRGYGSAFLWDISVDRVLNDLVVPEDKWQLVSQIAHKFHLEIPEDFSIDLKTKTMSGPVVLVKNSHSLDENEVIEQALYSARQNMRSHTWGGKSLRTRAMAVLDLFKSGAGTEWAKTLQGSVSRSARNAIADAFQTAVKDGSWRIRDASVIANVGRWISDYLSGEDELGLVNLMKLKLMVEKNLPVYSVEVVKEIPNASSAGTPAENR
jgi:hypothetical protein